MPKVRLEIPSHPTPIVADYQIGGNTFTVHVNDQIYQGTWVMTGVGEGWVSSNGHILPFYMTQKEQILQIWLDGHVYEIGLEQPGARRSGGAGSVALQGGDIKAPMPGTILKIPVQVGDKVEANQALVIMESMKMEMTLSAPAAATVKSVQCNEGQLVDMGSILIQLELQES